MHNTIDHITAAAGVRKKESSTYGGLVLLPLQPSM